LALGLAGVGAVRADQTAPRLVVRELSGLPPTDAELLEPAGGQRLWPLAADTRLTGDLSGRPQHAGQEDFTVDVTAGWNRRDREVILRYDVCDLTPVWPKGHGSRIERSDHCELWMCDFESGEVEHWGFSPGNFAKVHAYAREWLPKADDWPDGATVVSRSHTGGYTLVVRMEERPFMITRGVPRPMGVCLTACNVREPRRPAKDTWLASSARFHEGVWQTFNRLGWATCKFGGVLARSPDRRFQVLEVPQEGAGDPAAIPAFLLDRQSGSVKWLGRIQGRAISPDGAYLVYDYQVAAYERACAVVRLDDTLAVEDLTEQLMRHLKSDREIPRWVSDRALMTDSFVSAGWLAGPEALDADPHSLDVRFDTYAWAPAGLARRASLVYRHTVGSKSFDLVERTVLER